MWSSTPRVRCFLVHPEGEMCPGHAKIVVHSFPTSLLVCVQDCSLAGKSFPFNLTLAQFKARMARAYQRCACTHALIITITLAHSPTDSISNKERTRITSYPQIACSP